MATYPYMVQAASNVLNTVLEQWQREPYRWLRERDLQAEIGGRLTQVFMLQGLGSVRGEYRWAAPGFDKEQTWSRVSYEPYVGYDFESKHARCHPDIVVWKDLEPTQNANFDTTTGWPILWACELKYGSGNDGSWDVGKLKLLLEQNRIDFGCAVRVHYVSNAGSVGIGWTQNEYGRRLWIADVNAPKPQEDT